jgi:hypothetical protein
MNRLGMILKIARVACISAFSATAYATAPSSDAIPPELKAVDADSRNVFINHPGRITLVIGTDQDSQDAARAAGKAMYPFQGLRNFRLIVIADVRDSIATWVPSLVLSRMRVSLDHEAFELKPYFLKNGNPDDPRKYSCAIADFNGTICPQLGWTKPSSHLRGILFGTDGRELERWDNIPDMTALQTEVRQALHGSPAGQSPHPAP